MYCVSCGRHHEDVCHCLYQKPISKFEGLLILLAITVSPIFVFTKAYQNSIGFFQDYLVLGSITFSFILLFISLITWITKKSYLALLFGCHQKSHRTIYIFKKPLNICSRCSGIFVGVLFSVGYFMIELPMFIILLLALPLVIDGAFQKYSSNYESNNVKRLITGILFGPVMMYLYVGYHYLLVKVVFYILNLIY